MKREGKIHILFSAFLVVCACCRNKVLQIETRERERGAGESSFSFPFSFPLLESWFGTSEDKKDFKVGCFVVVSAAPEAAPCGVRGVTAAPGGRGPGLGPELRPQRSPIAPKPFPFPLQPSLVRVRPGCFPKFVFCYLWN